MLTTTEQKLLDLYQKDIHKYLWFKNFYTNDGIFLQKIVNEVVTIKNNALINKHLMK